MVFRACNTSYFQVTVKATLPLSPPLHFLLESPVCLPVSPSRFCSTEDGTQALTHAGPALYCVAPVQPTRVFGCSRVVGHQNSRPSCITPGFNFLLTAEHVLVILSAEVLSINFFQSVINQLLGGCLLKLQISRLTGHFSQYFGASIP